jgi:hypothetical protein
MRKGMKKTIRKKLLVMFAACTFAILMMFNVNSTINGTDFSIDGYMQIVSGSTAGAFAYCTTCYGGCAMYGYDYAACGSTGCMCSCSGGFYDDPYGEVTIESECSAWT